MVAGINSERKQKSQKAKPKASEGRMHLSNVRVIQRNLVYIIGLPLNLADEDVGSFCTIAYSIIPFYVETCSLDSFISTLLCSYFILLYFHQVLQRREFFGQYGKVLKVSISRTATGAIQHSSNNSCCV